MDIIKILAQIAIMVISFILMVTEIIKITISIISFNQGNTNAILFHIVLLILSAVVFTVTSPHNA